MLRFPSGVLASLFLVISCTSSGTDGSGNTSGGTYPGYPGAGGNYDPMPGAAMRCFFGEADPLVPAATIEHTLEIFEGAEAVHIRLTLDPRFVDNTYGDGSMGWGNKGHAFSKFVSSDHAQILLFDRNDELAMDFRIDYISGLVSAPSGYASLGVAGGDGELKTGEMSTVLATSTSIDRNLNERGYVTYTEHSPTTDERYTPDPAAPDWDYRVIYEVWVSNEAFAAGFKTAKIEYIHASPAKDGDTIIVEPDPCPPDWGCNDPDGCDGGDNDPYCNDPDGCDNGPNGDPDPACNDPDGCDNTPTDPNPDPECVDDDDCGPSEFCAEEGVCLPYVT